jgi:hypothetical protein
VLQWVRSKFGHVKVLVTLAAVLALGAGALAIGAVPNNSGRISACYVTNGPHQGDLRLLIKGGSCRRGERKIAWSQRGVAGAPGARGAPAGPSDAYNQGVSPITPGGLSLPAGGYYVTANVEVTNTSGTALNVTCTLTIGPPSTAPGAKDINTVTVAPGAKALVPLQQIHELSESGPANASCDGGNWGGLIIALRVGAVHEI